MTRISYRDYLYTFLLIFGLLFLNLTPLVPSSRGSILAITTPLQYGLTTLGHRLAGEADFWRRVRALSQQASDLEKDKNALLTQLITLKEVERENRLLRDQLSLKEERPNELILAKVVGFGGVESSSMLVVDKGQREGVTKESVVVYGSNLVGKVVEVSDKTSFVRLILDNDLRVGALDQDSPQRARGVVSGQFSRLMLMDRILREEEVKVGDIILTSGEDASFPKGLVIGEVTAEDSGPEGLLKQVNVQSLLNLTRLEEVFILKSK